MESEKLVGGLFEEAYEKQVQMSTAEIAMVSPDSGFINLLRFGMLALRLLPHSSLSSITKCYCILKKRLTLPTP